MGDPVRPSLVSADAVEETGLARLRTAPSAGRARHVHRRGGALRDGLAPGATLLAPLRGERQEHGGDAFLVLDQQQPCHLVGTEE